MKYKLNQTLCKIDWAEGRPYLRVGIVTKTTKSTYYVGHAKKRSSDWHAGWQDAIDLESENLLSLWGKHPNSQKAWHKKLRDVHHSPREIVSYLCRIRRLEAKIRKIPGLN